MNVTKLNTKGISHIILPLVVVLGLAVGGTFAMVASKAATPGKPAVKTASKSYLMIFSGNGSYNKAQITVEGTDKKTLKCRTEITPGKVLVQNLSTKKQANGLANATRIPCSALDSGTYKIKYGNNDKFDGPTVSFGIQKGQCTFVHPKSPNTFRIATAKGCDGGQLPDAIVKVENAVVRVLPTVANQSVRGIVTVSAADSNLNRTQCSSTAAVLVSGGNAVSTLKVKLKYVPVSSKNPSVKFSYCAGRIPATDKLAVGEYSVMASLEGNEYLAGPTTSAVASVKK